MKILFANVGGLMFGYKDFVKELENEFPEIEFIVPKSGDEAPRLAVDADVCFGIPTIETFEAAQKLKWVHQPASGVHVPNGHGLPDSDVILTNSPGPHVTPMADYTIAVMLAWTHRMEERFTDQRNQVWDPDRYEDGLEELTGKNIAILGFGGVGQAIAKRVISFDMNVYALARNEKTTTMPVKAVWGQDRVDELMTVSEWLVITAPLTPETKGMIDKRRIAMMPKGSRIIVLSRAHIIDESALLEALSTGQIDKVAFDNFENGELGKDSPLWMMPNVFLTPHTSSNSVNLEPGRRQIFRENLRRFLNNQPLVGICDKKLGY